MVLRGLTRPDAGSIYIDMKTNDLSAAAAALGRRGAATTNSRLTPEQRRANASLGGLAAQAKMTKKEMKRRHRLAAETRKANKVKALAEIDSTIN